MDASSRTDLRKQAIRPALLVAGVYVFVSAVWILASDRVVDVLFAPEAMSLAQTLKGWAFVTVTGVLIFYGCYRLNRSLLATETLERLAHYDPATGLPNKLLFLPLVETALQQAAHRREPAAMMVVRLNGLERYSQGLAFDPGDPVAAVVAGRIAPCLQADHRLARLDERTLAVLVPGPVTPDRVALLAESLISVIVIPVQVEHAEISVHPAVGASFYPDDALTTDRLLHTAEAAAARATRRGEARVAFYTSGISRAAFERFQIESRLKKAIEEGGLTVAYQPQVDLRSREIVGAETLVRWHDAQLGQMSPAVFIPLAEEAGLIGRITRFVLQRTLATLAEMDAEGLSPIRIAVNVSGREIAAGGIERLIPRLSQEYRVTPDRLEIELTETAAMDDPESTALALQALRAVGVHVALDDFATGYSSLAQLHQFSLDKLKIDRGFVAGLPHDQKNLGICKAVISMADTLGLGVVAEGVETEAAARALAEMGCHLAQGYFFYKPLPETDFLRLMRVETRRVEAGGTNVALFRRRGEER